MPGRYTCMGDVCEVLHLAADVVHLALVVEVVLTLLGEQHLDLTKEY